MSSDNPTFAEIAEENIRQHRSKPLHELLKDQLDEMEGIPYTPYEADVDD